MLIVCVSTDVAIYPVSCYHNSSTILMMSGLLCGADPIAVTMTYTVQRLVSELAMIVVDSQRYQPANEQQSH